jgi:hypothetical protein
VANRVTLMAINIPENGGRVAPHFTQSVVIADRSSCRAYTFASRHQIRMDETQFLTPFFSVRCASIGTHQAISFGQ